MIGYRRGGNAVDTDGPEAPNASTLTYDGGVENNYGLGSEYRSPQTVQTEAVASQAAKPSWWLYLVFGAVAALVLL